MSLDKKWSLSSSEKLPPLQYMYILYIFLITLYASWCIGKYDDLYEEHKNLKLYEKTCQVENDLMTMTGVFEGDGDLFSNISMDVKDAGWDTWWKIILTDIKSNIKYTLTSTNFDMPEVLLTNTLWYDMEIPDGDETTDIILNTWGVPFVFENIWCSENVDITNIEPRECNNDGCTMKTKIHIETTWDKLKQVFFYISNINDTHRVVTNPETWKIWNWSHDTHDIDLWDDHATDVFLTVTWGEWDEDTDVNIHYNDGESREANNIWCEYFCSSWDFDNVHSSFDANNCNCEGQVDFVYNATCNTDIPVKLHFSTTTGINISKPITYTMIYTNGESITYASTAQDGTLSFVAYGWLKEIQVKYVSVSIFVDWEKAYLQTSTHHDGNTFVLSDVSVTYHH